MSKKPSSHWGRETGQWRRSYGVRRTVLKAYIRLSVLDGVVGNEDGEEQGLHVEAGASGFAVRCCRDGATHDGLERVKEETEGLVQDPGQSDHEGNDLGRALVNRDDYG